MATPHKCPVCGGKGTVPGGFYYNASGSTAIPTDETCRSCDGKGIVWEPPNGQASDGPIVSGDVIIDGKVMGHWVSTYNEWRKGRMLVQRGNP